MLFKMATLKINITFFRDIIMLLNITTKKMNIFFFREQATLIRG